MQILLLSKEHIWIRSIHYSRTTYLEEKTIIKSLSCLKQKWKLEHPKYNKADAYNQLEKHEQVVTFRLRTNHSKLK